MEAFALITTGITCTGHSRRFYHVAHVYSGSPWCSRARTSRFRRDSRQPNYWVRNIDLDVRIFDGRTEVFVPLCVLRLVSHFADLWRGRADTPTASITWNMCTVEAPVGLR